MIKTFEIRNFLVLATVITSFFSCATSSQAAEMDSFAVNETAESQELQVEKHIKELEKLGIYYFCLGQYKQSKECLELSLQAIKQAVKAGELPKDYENLDVYSEMLEVVGRLADNQVGA